LSAIDWPVMSAAVIKKKIIACFLSIPRRLSVSGYYKL
jgi:hypothetical protein